MASVAVVAKRLAIGDLVEIDGRQYDVVSDKAGGVALEPAITVFSADLDERDGTQPVDEKLVDELFGDLPRDGEG